MNAQKQALLQALDIPVWIQKTASHAASGLSTQVWQTTTRQEQALTLDALRQCITECKLCPLHITRTQTVVGTGNEQAKVMVIGEAPGFHEDQQGEPFVGRAGQLLNAMLQSIGFERKDVYIANIVKCKPPNNRDPLATEIAQCTPYLKQQIALIKPDVLCAVGKIAGQYLLNTTEPLSVLRKKQHFYGEQNTPLIITYHPAYLLRNPQAKADAYQDLLQLQELVHQDMLHRNHHQ